MTKESLRLEGERLEEDLKSKLSHDDYESVVSLSMNSMSREKEVTKTRHIKKLENLMDRRKERNEAAGYNLRPEGLQRWVVNLSEHRGKAKNLITSECNN